MQSSINFKGGKEGLIVSLDKDVDFDVIKNDLADKLEEKKEYFDGVDLIMTFKGRKLDTEERLELSEIINKKTSLKISEPKTKKKYGKKSEILTKYHKGTVRSGQRIQFDGSIVILGDVNPGAEIVASGNIIILGKLNGLAHAGFKGDADTFIVAFKMEPTQLRIGETIARAPDKNYEFDKSTAQIVYLKENTLFIEAADIDSFAKL